MQARGGLIFVGAYYSRIFTGGWTFKWGVISGGGEGGYSRSQVTVMIEWGQKLKPKNIPRPLNKIPKNPWTKILPLKNPVLNFQTTKISRKQWNVCICLFITPSGARPFFTSGGDCDNTRDTQEHILLQQ